MDIISKEQLQQLKAKGASIKVISKSIQTGGYVPPKFTPSSGTTSVKKPFLEKVGDIFTPLLTTFGRTLAMGDYIKAQDAGMKSWQDIGNVMMNRWKTNPNLTKEQKQKEFKVWQDSVPKIIEQHPDFNKTIGQIAGEALQTGTTLLTLAEAVPGIAKGITGMVGKIPGVGKGLAQLGATEIATPTLGKTLGMKFLAVPEGFTKSAILQRAGISAIYGTTYGVAKALKEKQDPLKAFQTIATGGISSGLISLGVDGILLGINKFIEKYGPSISETMTGRPKQAFKTQYENPEEAEAAFKRVSEESKKFKYGGGERVVTEEAEGAIKDFRTGLSKEYKQNVAKLAKTYKGPDMILNEDQQRLLLKIKDDFPTALPNLPKDISGPMSPRSFVDLYEDINNIGRKMVGKPTDAAQRIMEAKDVFKNLGIKSYGGKTGEFATMLSDYSTKVTILNNMDDMVNAWKTNPRAVTGATKQLLGAFKENYYSYLDTIGKFEQLTGKSFINEISTLVTQKYMPVYGAVDSSDIMRVLGLPLFSPRIHAAIGRGIITTNAKIINDLILRKYIIPQGWK